jgi:hypothetical protein
MPHMCELGFETPVKASTSTRLTRIPALTLRRRSTHDQTESSLACAAENASATASSSPLVAGRCGVGPWGRSPGKLDVGSWDGAMITSLTTRARRDSSMASKGPRVRKGQGNGRVLSSEVL